MISFRRVCAEDVQTFFIHRDTVRKWLLFTAWLFTTLNSQVDTRNGWNLGRPSPKVILNDGPELLFTGIREQ